jgi:hypothetical protein
MTQGLRDQVITLACLRFSLPAHQGRGVDQLPGPYQATLEDTLVPKLCHEALVLAFTSTINLLLDEVDHIDSTLAQKLRPPLVELTRSVRSARPQETLEPQPPLHPPQRSTCCAGQPSAPGRR